MQSSVNFDILLEYFRLLIKSIQILIKYHYSNKKMLRSNIKCYSKLFELNFDLYTFKYHYSNQNLIQIVAISNTFE